MGSCSHVLQNYIVNNAFAKSRAETLKITDSFKTIKRKRSEWQSVISDGQNGSHSNLRNDGHYVRLIWVT